MDRLCNNWLRFMVLLCFWAQAHHGALAMNVTVLDTDPQIVYQPSISWHASTDSCTFCLVPTTSSSYHEAIRLGGDDSDDPPPTQSSASANAPSGVPAQLQSSPQSTPQQQPPQQAPPVQSQPAQVTPPAAPAQSSPSPSPTSTSGDNSGSGGGGGGGGNSGSNSGSGSSGSNSGSGNSGSNSGSGGSGSNNSGGGGDDGGGKDNHRRWLPPRELVPRLDGDDIPGSNLSISLAFNFTGSSIYVFGWQPLASSTPDGVPTNLNLTFLLDSLPPVLVTRGGQPGLTGFNNILLFSQVGMEEQPHQLVVNVGMNSIFLFDHLVYTTNSTSTTTPLAQASPSSSIDPKTKKHNIATFVGAVGGSVGVLSLFALGLAISIIRRRRLSARRDRLDHESLHTNGSDDTPHMSGPAPFVPRFFPDTIIPSDPPTYVDALRTNQNGSTLLDSLGQRAYPASRSYADIPPSSPPPPIDDPIIIPPPPPFLTVTSNEMESAAVVPRPSAVQSSHTASDSVGIDSPNSEALPETVPLLQSVDNETRPRSRTSLRSSHHEPDPGSTPLMTRETQDDS